MSPTELISIPEADYQVRFVERGADNAGSRLVTEWSVPSYAGPPEHWHPQMTESWEVLDGVLIVTIDGEERVLTAGQSATAPPGVHHAFRAEGPIRWRQTNEPALQHELLFHLDAQVARTHGASGSPGPIQTIRILAAADAVFAGPPIGLQKVLAVLGSLLNRKDRRALL